jgi:hypothetical protein
MLHAFGKPTHDDNGNKISAEAKSKPYMMVGYTQNSTTIRRMWAPEFKAVKAQSEVIFDEDRNAHVSCLQGNENDIFELPQETKYVEELEDNTSGTGEGHGSGAHGRTDEISDALQRRRLPASIANKE